MRWRPAYRDGRRGVSTVGTELIAGFVEWGLKRDVNQVIIEFEPMWVLRALQLHFLATPLGYQRTYGNQQVVATLLTFNEHTLDVVRSRRNHFAPVLARGYPDMLGHKAGVVRSETVMSVASATRTAQPHADRHRVVE